MDFRVAVDLAGGGLKDTRPAAFRHSENVDGPKNGGLHRLDRIELVVSRRSRTGQVEDLIHFQIDRDRNVVPDQLKIRVGEKMADVGFLAREKIVETNDVVPQIKEPFAQKGTEETGTARDENTFE